MPSLFSSKKVKWIILSTLCCFFILFVTVKELGTYYTKKIIDRRLQEAGLSAFIHYQTISFQPFTLTPSLESVTLGNERYPWLALKTLSMKWLPLTYPNLDVSFQFDPSKPLARDSHYLLSKLGIHALRGSGHFVSNKTDKQLTSKLTLDIQQVGTLHWMSKLDLLTDSVSLQEFRSDLLASMALGQMSAMPILYGDSIAFETVDVRFHDSGLVAHLFPHPPSKQQGSSSEQVPITAKLENTIATLGLAKTGSNASKYIADQLFTFWQQPNTLTITMTPKRAISLTDIMLLSQEKQLYDGAKITIKNR